MCTLYAHLTVRCPILGYSFFLSHCVLLFFRASLVFFTYNRTKAKKANTVCTVIYIDCSQVANSIQMKVNLTHNRKCPLKKMKENSFFSPVGKRFLWMFSDMFNCYLCAVAATAVAVIAFVCLTLLISDFVWFLVFLYLNKWTFVCLVDKSFGSFFHIEASNL